MFEDPDDVDEDDVPARWKQNRKFLKGDLETEYQTTPFETYKLFRGKQKSMMGGKSKQVSSAIRTIYVVSLMISLKYSHETVHMSTGWVDEGDCLDMQRPIRSPLIFRLENDGALQETV